MMESRSIRRYAAYFKNWAQAFGEHRGHWHDGRLLNWLIGDDQLGLILTPVVRRALFREILGHHLNEVDLTIGPDTIALGRLRAPREPGDGEVVRFLRWLLDAPGDLHLYLTYHLIYPPGTRILTLSRKSPMPIFYREIAPLQINPCWEGGSAADPWND